MAEASERHTDDWPIWWFAQMEAARERGDFETAARAKRRLERLGIAISFHPPGRQRRKGVACRAS